MESRAVEEKGLGERRNLCGEGGETEWRDEAVGRRKKGETEVGFVWGEKGLEEEEEEERLGFFRMERKRIEEGRVAEE